MAASNLVLNLSHPLKSREGRAVYQSPKQPPNTGVEGRSKQGQGSLTRRDMAISSSTGAVNNRTQRRTAGEKEKETRSKDPRESLIQDIDPSRYYRPPRP